MKRVGFVVVALTVAGICFAEGKPSGKAVQSISKSQEKTVQHTPSPARTPTGPNGFGALKIGMSKEAVESLSEKDGVYLSSPMAPFSVGSYRPKVGEELYQSRLSSPLSAEPIKIGLTFVNSELHLMTLFVSEASENVAKSVFTQISDRYGSGDVTNNRKEEQCIYKNGSNFKIVKGSVITKWVEAISPTERIETEFNDWTYSSCPVNLSYDTVSESNSKTLTIKKVRSDTTAGGKSNNLF